MSGVFKNNKRTPVKDMLTNQEYPSKYKAGKALARGFGLDPTDKFVWYKIVKRARLGRFIEVETGRIVKYQ